MQRDQKIKQIKIKHYTDKVTGLPILNTSAKADELIEQILLLQNSDGYIHITYTPIKDGEKIYYIPILNTYIPKHKRNY